jgi:nucleoid DNA-binding protein
METVANFIHGECVTGSGQRVQAIFNPATGEQIKIPARTAIKITPAKALKDTFNKKGKK